MSNWTGKSGSTLPGSTTHVLGSFRERQLEKYALSYIMFISPHWQEGEK